MKLKGKKIEGVNKIPIVIPRGTDGEIVFWAQAIMNPEEFEKKCPPPNPPVMRKRDGSESPDYNDVNYLVAEKNYGALRMAYFIIYSLAATPDLEWELVNINDPNTWLRYREELKESGITGRETEFIISKVMEANALNESKLEEARKRFLASQAEIVQTPLSLTDDPLSMLSGDPVNGSESSHLELNLVGTNAESGSKPN